MCVCICTLPGVMNRCNAANSAVQRSRTGLAATVRQRSTAVLPSAPLQRSVVAVSLQRSVGSTTRSRPGLAASTSDTMRTELRQAFRRHDSGTSKSS